MILLGLSGTLSAQSGGTISGKIFNSDSTETVPFAIVRMEVAGDTISTKADFNGKYSFFAVSPGKYNISCESDLFGKRKVTGISVSSDQISKVDIVLMNSLEIIEVVYREPKININNVTKISPAELKNNPLLQNPKAMLVAKSSEISMTQDNQLIIRGSRPGDVIYYVDGVKQSSMQGLPGVAIGGMQVFTGGIPAKYGDTTGGVVILETKSYFDLYYAWKSRQ